MPAPDQVSSPWVHVCMLHSVRSIYELVISRCGTASAALATKRSLRALCNSSNTYVNTMATLTSGCTSLAHLQTATGVFSRRRLASSRMASDTCLRALPRVKDHGVLEDAKIHTEQLKGWPICLDENWDVLSKQFKAV